MSGRVPEHFDDAHPMPTGRTGQPEGDGVGALIVVMVCRAHSIDVEQCTGGSDLLTALPVSEHSIVAYAVEPIYAPRRINGFMQSPCLCGVERSRAGPVSWTGYEHSA